MEIVYKEDGLELEEIEIDKELDTNEIVYYFIVDRSGSMSGKRIELTKSALKLFL